MTIEQPAPVNASVRFALDSNNLSKLAKSRLLDEAAPPPRGQRHVATYFDTAAFALAKAGLALHTRKQRRGFILALNGEEAAVAGEVPDLAALGPERVAQLAEILQDSGLEPVFQTDVKRVTRRMDGVEIGLETGFIRLGDGRKIALHEVELRGEPGALYAAALALLAEFPLVLQPASAAWRGLWAAGAKRPAQVRAGDGLKGAPSLDEAVESLIRSCIDQFTANWPVFAHGDEVGAVHQMRVAMRRLRAVLGLFAKALPAAEFAEFRAEAKRIAGTMGEARDWDVFTALLKDGPAAAFSGEKGFAPLLKQCAEFRATGYAHVRALLGARDATRFVLEMEAFLARKSWRNGIPWEGLPALLEPATIFAGASLARLQRKVRKRGRHMAHLGAHERHMVRIELKKLRYAADLFGGLFEARGRVRAYNKATAELQEEFGVLNDLATAETLLARLDTGKVETARAAGIVLGWCGHSAQANGKALVKSWKAFGEVKPFTE